MKFGMMSRGILLLALVWAGIAHAGLPDRYIGDTSIYSGTSVKLKPNVMILVDTSKNMSQGGGTDPYDKNTVYPGTYATNMIYSQLNAGNYQAYVADVNAAGVCAEAKTALLEYGFYNKGLKKTSGDCSSKSSDIGNYYLGNLLNKTQAVPAPTATWQPSTAYAVGDVVRPTDASNTNTYRCTNTGTSGLTEPTWPTAAGGTVTDNGVGWEITATLMEVVKAVLKQAAGALAQDIKIGIATVGPNNAGGYVRAEVKDVSPVMFDPGTGTMVPNPTGIANFDALTTVINNLGFISSNTSMPMNEALYDMLHYYQGNNDSTQKLASGAAVFSAPAPIDYACQKNYVLVLTTGSSTASPQAEGAVGDQDGNGLAGRVDDAAKLLYETDMLPDVHGADKTEGYQRVQTSVIQLMTSYVQELDQTTDGSHGRGDYFLANNTEELTDALLNLMNNIVREAETAFVAPVVPASPENRTYSGKRIYIGFFKPISQKPWYGNLKKFGINSDLEIVSANGVDLATNNDGTFNAGATSFWSDNNNQYTVTGDSGDVQRGGVGGQLMARNLATAPRKIWTWTGNAAKMNMTDTENLVALGNANLTSAMLDVADATERSKLIKYLQGYDGYNDGGNGDTEKREWLLGDILHSKPLVVNYKRYVLTEANESDPAINKTFIFQGANDGMLHCFRDADGGEEWAFIPPDLLPRLKNLRDTAHSYFVDGTPSVYIHDANNDGQVVPADGDFAILIFGLRRGGGLQSLSEAGFRGGFYALDVSNPAAPKYIGKISNLSANFGEMAETWAQPRLARVQVGSQRKIVAFVGAGYDTVEDLRFGNTQTYPSGATEVPLPSGAPDSFIIAKSDDGAAPQHPRGRGIYAIQVADLVPTAVGATTLKPDFSGTGNLVWGYVYGASDNYSNGVRTSPAMTYSIASDIAAMDFNADGLNDRLYVGDLGGNLWRFNVGSFDVANWSAKKVFSANPGNDVDSNGTSFQTEGRKIFYKPDMTVHNGAVILYFGSGDRAHPMNYLNPGPDGAVIDRLYAVKDIDSVSGTITEDDLYDATENKLQQDLTPAQIQAERDALAAAKGWYIRLDVNAGEKALAPVSIFNKVAFYSTYQPDSLANIDAANNPCDPGNLGFSRLYALDAETGEAVLNFVTGTGTDAFGEDQATADNKRSQGKDEEGTPYILRRADREVSLGGGIPSGMVFVIGADGSVSAIIAANISFPVISLPGDGTVFPVFWTQW
ncbi:PilC/PilY family type IV pilus protein [Desulfuromonas carbonis]